MSYKPSFQDITHLDHARILIYSPETSASFKEVIRLHEGGSTLFTRKAT